MIPDFVVRGIWVDWFLIYWATCYCGYFIIGWTCLGLRPEMYYWTHYLHMITRSLIWPILLPLRFWITWRWRVAERAAEKAMDKENFSEHMQMDNSLRDCPIPKGKVTNPSGFGEEKE